MLARNGINPKKMVNMIIWKFQTNKALLKEVPVV